MTSLKKFMLLISTKLKMQFIVVIVIVVGIFIIMREKKINVHKNPWLMAMQDKVTYLPATLE